MLKRFCFFLIIIIIIISAPWLDGALFKKNYLHIIELINQDNRVKITVLDYQEGWARSYVKLRVTVGNNGLSSPFKSTKTLNVIQPINFIVEQDINHGPFIFNTLRQQIGFGYANIYSKMHFPEQMSVTVEAANNDQFFDMNTLARFTGEWVGKINIPKFTITVSPLGKVVWEGLDGDYTLNFIHDLLTKISVNMRIGSMQVLIDAKNDYVTQIQTQPSIYVNDTYRNGRGLWSGKASLDVPGLKITKADNSELSVEDINLNSAYGIGGNTFYNNSIFLNLKKINTNNVNVPDIALLHIEILASNFDSEAMLDYARYFKSSTNEAMQNIDFNTLETLLVHTVMENTKLNAKVMAQTDWGKLLLDSQTAWDAVAPRPETLDNVIHHTVTTIKVEVSQEIATKLLTVYQNDIKIPEQADGNTLPAKLIPPKSALTPAQILDGLLRIGYIMQNDQDYITTFTIENAIIKWNGRELFN